ncbi:hypothetical protein [Flavobacterium sp. 140616W15]|uniref:hypothetical protein n=1 Tax=Flavobacterium sp. 140616W15 TaxID=2478552 RepID=UPI000F0D0822|nr:hypothetical protein [Flavobacterium sp. 140616W15]AYN04403.1 hypothetical protein EAG11_09580 [Flavobacterium sp. 140616W15]
MFKIKFNCENVIGTFDEDDETVGEAIESSFGNYDTDVFIYWNSYIIYLNKKCDISDIYNDIIKMILCLKENNTENIAINFLSSNFTAKWDFSIKKDFIAVTPRWINVSLEYEGKMIDIQDLHSIREDIILNIDIKSFIDEWNNLLLNIKKHLISIGYNNNLEGFEYLESI